ncbi:MFS transporter [Sandaracinobacter sp. RS1-74]|uniref:MFS transporter n=1 Tax=Sandaracinobacteroides sayramensis TaxID=2913411 RepID=UPI001EDC89BB|nr:MFS transporter [Sandaracinobacteroides sayramensis]MCG2842683.1 MFS transporter [Sandaracinobacteroides sayramensis]
MNQSSPVSDSTSAPRAWPVLAALALGGFAIGTTEFATMSLLPFFAPDLGVSEAQASHVISVYALGVVIGAPLLAVLGARMDRRRLLIALMLLFAAGNALSAIASGFQSMLLFRFLSGVPHGAYFGVAALMAASLVPPNRRAQAMAKVMLGLTLATIIGVPFANAVGQQFGWRWGFGIVAACALTTAALIALFAPSQPARAGQSPLTELGALANGRVWLTLSIGAIGFGGLFAVYTYLASTILQVTLAPPSAIPAMLAVFGLGMTIGTLVAGWGADKALMPTVGGMLALAALMLFLFPFAAHSLWTMAPVVFLIGLTGSFGVPLQARLMDVAGEAQTLAASLHHSAFNFANALGPWLAGMAVAAGHGFESSGFVGAGLALGGLLMWGVALLSDRRIRGRAAPPAPAGW